MNFNNPYPFFQQNYYPFLNYFYVNNNQVGLAQPQFVSHLPTNAMTEMNIRTQEKQQLEFGQTLIPYIQKLKQTLQELHSQGKFHKKTHWTSSEDDLLIELVQKQQLEWKQIPNFFEGRTQNMCYSRYRRIIQNSKEKSWTKEQGDLVVKLVNRFGQKWKRISEQIPKYSPKQIRQRYLNYLRPNLLKSNFTYEQDYKICTFVISNGKHWRKLEDLLPGRPEGVIKGRYYGKLQEVIESVKGKSLQQQEEEQ